LWLLLAFALTATAQVDKMPQFGLMQTNGKQYNTSALLKDRPTLLVYFAPDCDHCITFLNALFKGFDPFKRAQVLLVTFKPVKDLVPFERTYAIAKYKNIVVGSESKPLFLQMHYRLQNTPYVALYDKNGILIRGYKKDPSVKEIAKLLGGLK
jgi:cytochrome oxidase Cu insertion factor (SCO1/SenC/PrrC family)